MPESEKMKLFRERSNKIQGFKFQLRKKITPAETAFRKVLRENNIKYLFQRPFHSKDFKCIADLFLKSDKANIVVEIDGGYHLSEGQIRKDRYRSKWLIENRKCNIIRFTNEIVLKNPNECINKLATFYLEVVGHVDNPSSNYLIFNTIKTNL